MCSETKQYCVYLWEIWNTNTPPRFPGLKSNKGNNSCETLQRIEGGCTTWCDTGAMPFYFMFLILWVTNYGDGTWITHWLWQNVTKNSDSEIWWLGCVLPPGCLSGRSVWRYCSRCKSTEKDRQRSSLNHPLTQTQAAWKTDTSCDMCPSWKPNTKPHKQLVLHSLTHTCSS